jgi:hypothetical protein
MRIFVTSVDLTGCKRNTRVNLHDCPTTTALARTICKELGLSRRAVVLKLKAEPYNVLAPRPSSSWLTTGTSKTTHSRTAAPSSSKSSTLRITPPSPSPSKK